MPNNITLTADFENIDPIEFTATALYLLESEAWVLLDYNHAFLHAEKRSLGNENVTLVVRISGKEVIMECSANLEEKALQAIVDYFVTQLTQHISMGDFDAKVQKYKHTYFKANPVNSMLEEAEVEESGSRRHFLGFSKHFKVTPSLVILNALVFIAMLFSGVHILMPETAEVLNWGANFRSFVLNGQWWRLLSSCFIHIGIIHILFNMWALFSVGVFLEPLLGSWRFGFAYVIAGLAGSLNSIIFHFATPSAGASGAIFGMFGLLLALLTTSILDKNFRTSMLKSILPMILFNLLLGTSAMIDNAGHIGGLIAGLICGYLFAWHYKNPKNKLIMATSFALPVVLILTTAWTVKIKLPDTFAQYQNILKEVTENEKQGLAYLNQQQYDSLKAVQTWDKALAEMKKADALNLNDQMEERNAVLVQYLHLRKKQSILYVNERENINSIRQVNQSVDSILKILNKGEE